MQRTPFRFRHKDSKKRIKFYEDKQVVDEVFQKFQETGWTLQEIAKESNIPYSCIQKWHSDYQKDKSYRPGKKLGQHRRYFTKEQEKNVADYLRDNYILPGRGVKRKHLRLILFDCWQQFDIENRGNIILSKKMFTYKFLKQFCKRQKLSFRTIRGKKRSEIDKLEVSRFKQKRDIIFQKYPKNRIGNMDETSWHFVFARGQVLAERGVENVCTTLPEDKRASFTTIATVLADGSKCNPFFLAQGKTIRCHQQFDGMTSDPSTYEIWHAPGKNTDEETMIVYLEKFYQWMHKEPSALFLDQYPSHESENIRQKASELGIELIFIPKSATDLYQPLDRTVFGALKASAASMYDDKFFNEDKAYTKSEAADLFIDLWSKLRKSTVVSGWQKTMDDEEEEESPSSDSSEYLVDSSSSEALE